MGIPTFINLVFNHEVQSNLVQKLVISVEVKVNLQCECDNKAMIDSMKDLEFHLQEKRKQGVSGQVHAVDEPTANKPLEREKEFIDLDSNVEACMVEVDNYSSHADDYQPLEYATKQVNLKLPLDLVLLIELNLVESPTQQQIV